MRDHLGNFVLSSNLSFAKGILLLDDCEGSFNWSITGTDATATASYETDAAFSGTNGIKLDTGDTDPGVSDYCQISKLLSMPESGLLVARAKICLPDISMIQAVKFDFYYPYDGDVWNAYLYWLVNTPSVSYLNSAGGLTEITEMSYDIIDNCWINIELVADLFQKKYISAFWNGIEKDLSGISMRDIGNSDARYIRFAISCFNAGAAQSFAYIDNIYVGEFQNI